VMSSGQDDLNASVNEKPIIKIPFPQFLFHWKVKFSPTSAFQKSLSFDTIII